MIEMLHQDRLIHLRNDSVSYIIYLLEGGVPAHLYFGKRVESLNPASMLRRYDLPVDGSFSLQGCALDHTPHEYPAHGLGDLREGMARSGIDFTWDDAAVQYLTHKSYSVKFGARNLRRAIQTDLEDPIAERIIQSYMEPFCSIKATCEDGKLKLETM